MKLKKILGMLLAIGMLLSLAACGSSGGTSDSEDVYRIGFAQRLGTDIFLKNLETEFCKLAADDPTLEVIVADANDDAQKQIDQVNNFFAQEVDCLILMPSNSENLIPSIQQASEKGIPVYCLSQQASEGDFIYVGISDYATGYEQGVYCHENLPENAKVLYLGGNSGFKTSIDRKQGLLDGLDDRLKENGGDVEILSYMECMYTRDEGMKITEDWIQAFDDFDAIVACSDQPGCGAIQALKAANRTDGVMVISIDGLDDALVEVQEGFMTMTVRQDPVIMSKTMYDVIKDTQAGKPPTEDVICELVLVTSENVDQFVK